MNAPAWTFDNTSMVVVVGHNPENADITNPTGAIHGVLNFVRAYNEHGDTRELAVTSGSLDPMLAAMTLADRLNRRMSLGKLPVGFDLWPAGRPIYGSDAYVEYGQADDLAIEERERDDERWARIGG
jgi:hypothetical protein